MIKNSTKFLSISVAGVAALAMLAPSAVAGEKKLPAKRVVVQSAVIVSGDAGGPDPQDPTVKAAARGKHRPAEVSFTVPAGTAKAQKKAEKEALNRAQAELARRAADSSGKALTTGERGSADRGRLRPAGAYGHVVPSAHPSLTRGVATICGTRLPHCQFSRAVDTPPRG